MSKKFRVILELEDKEHRFARFDAEWLAESLKNVGLFNALGGCQVMSIEELKIETGNS